MPLASLSLAGQFVRVPGGLEGEVVASGVVTLRKEIPILGPQGESEKGGPHGVFLLVRTGGVEVRVFRRSLAATVPPSR